METSKLKKLAWVFFALALTTTTLFAQGWRNGNRPFYGSNNNCINLISGLSDEQKTKIDGLNKSHLETMSQLRTQRQSSTDAIEKSEIRTTMLKTVKAHREEVKSMLTAEQQKEFDALQQRANYGNGRGQGKGNCQTAGNFGNRNGRGQGNGNRCGQGCLRY